LVCNESSLPVGATFYVLNTKFTVLNKNYSFQLPTEGYKYVQTIEAQGMNEYERNDSYGVFNASYTWNEYFDPSTGYIVGYNYVEQDNGKYQGSPGSFTYTDNLYVTTTSYALTLANTPTGVTTTSSSGTNLFGEQTPYLGYLIATLVVVLLIIIVGVIVATRRRRRGNKLPEHPYPPYTPPPSPQSPSPWESKIDLGSRPPEQVVIRDVVKVNCKFCGTLIPSTADHCPYCGAPRQ
jgi:hypothetical protein